MNSPWLEQLRASGFDADLQSAGQPRSDARQTAAGSTVIAPLAHLGLIQVQGEDAQSFLHNLLTNDVNGIGENDLRRAGFCTPKGRMLADFLLWQSPLGILLQLSADLLPPILKKLSMYVLRAKAKLSDAGESFAIIGVAGPRAAELLRQLGLPQPAPMQHQAFDDGSILSIDAARFEIVIAADKASAMWQTLAANAQPVGIAAWRGLDIAAGIPQITAATSEAFVPQMVNYELIGGVGFKKGCYPGQEIVARTQYLGKIKRRMYRAHAEVDALAAGTAVYSAETGDQACGAVVSSAPSVEAGSELLLVAQTSAVGSGIRLGDPSGPVARIVPLPYAVE